MTAVMGPHTHEPHQCATCRQEARLARRTDPLPATLLADPAVPDGAVRLFGLLLLHGSTPEQCHPSLDVVAERMGVAVRTVRRWSAALARAGWVTRVPRFDCDGSPAPTGYFLYSQAQPTPRAVPA